MRVIKHDQCITHFHSVVCRPLSAPGPRPEPCDGWCRPRVPTIPGPGPEARRQSPGQQPLRPALLHYQRRLGSPDSVYWRPGLESRRAGPQPLALFQMSSRRGNRSGGGIPGGRPRDDRDQAGLWPIQTAAGFRQAAGQRRAGALSGVSICRGRVSCSEKNSSDSLSASNLQTFESALAHHKCGELSTNSKCSEQSELRGDCRQSGHRRQICIDEKACGLVLPHLHKQIGFLMPSFWYLKLVHICFGSIKAFALI